MGNNAAETSLLNSSGEPYREPAKCLRMIWCMAAFHPHILLCAQKQSPKDVWELDHQAWKIERFLCDISKQTGLAFNLRAAGFLSAEVEGVLPSGKPFKKDTSIFTYNQMMRVMGQYYRVDVHDPTAAAEGHYTDELRAMRNEQRVRNNRLRDEHEWCWEQVGQPGPAGANGAPSMNMR